MGTDVGSQDLSYLGTETDTRASKRIRSHHDSHSLHRTTVTSPNGASESGHSPDLLTQHDLRKWPFLANIIDLDSPDAKIPGDPDLGHSKGTSAKRLITRDTSTRNALSASASEMISSYASTTTAKADHVRANDLPNFIRTLPTRLESEDVAYLKAKGALTIPNSKLMIELLRQYVHGIHPYMPIVDLSELLEAIADNDGRVCIELLLFQTIMFTATAYIDLHYLQEEGYASRRAAREAFYRRARLLYEFDCGLDRIQVLKASLLLTYWVEPPSEPKGPSHWTGLCVSMVHTLALHPGSIGPNESFEAYRTRNSLWWACFMRDQLISLGMGRLSRMAFDEFEEDASLEMMTYTFKLDTLSQKARHFLGISYLEDDHCSVELSELFIGLLKLCICINRILRAQYRVQRKEVEKHDGIVILAPKPESFLDVIKWDSEIFKVDIVNSQWPLPPQSKSVGRRQQNVTLVKSYKGMLEMLRLSISSTLHRPNLSSSTTSWPPELVMLSNRRTTEAAESICKIMEDLSQIDMVRYLPPTAVTVVLPPISYYLHRIRGHPPSEANLSYSRIESCRKILHQLRWKYAIADSGCFFLESAAKALSIHLPPSPPQSDAASSIEQTSKTTGLSYLSPLQARPHVQILDNVDHVSSEACGFGLENLPDFPASPIQDCGSLGDEPISMRQVIIGDSSTTSARDYESRPSNALYFPVRSLADDEPDFISMSEAHGEMSPLGTGPNEGNHCEDSPKDAELSDNEWALKVPSSLMTTGDLEFDLAIGSDD